MTAAILRGDARCLPLADASVDLIATSPPFYALRSYTDGGQHYDGQIGSEATPGEYIETLTACTREWMRVLKPTGSLWLNVGDKYAGHTGGDRTPLANGGARGAPSTKRMTVGAPTKSLLGLPWRYALRCIDELGLILRAEVIWSKPNGLPESVLDPFSGTGTTALVAHALGRIGIGVDMSADYCRLAQWRTTDPGQLAAALEVDKPARQVDNQGDMLALLEGPS